MRIPISFSAFLDFDIQTGSIILVSTHVHSMEAAVEKIQLRISNHKAYVWDIEGPSLIKVLFHAREAQKHWRNFKG